MVMVSNQTGLAVGLLAGQFPARIGHLYSPGAARGPWAELPYALDNGAWGAFKHGLPWDVRAWRELLQWASRSGQQPLWALVPDVVGDRVATLARWDQYVDEVVDKGFRPAFALQDGMEPSDVPDAECVLFIGGSTKWKEEAIPRFGRAFPGRIHVGRVNTPRRLRMSHRAGAVSVDGTGWFHTKQQQALREFLKETTQWTHRRAIVSSC